MSEKFDARKACIKVQGKDYLPVAARLIWFRQDHPDWGIQTEIYKFDNTNADSSKHYAICRASIVSPEGMIMAEATKMEDRKGFPDFLEKSETSSIGRALAMCGYGTQFTTEFDEGKRLADTPIQLEEKIAGKLEKCPDCDEEVWVEEQNGKVFRFGKDDKPHIHIKK